MRLIILRMTIFTVMISCVLIFSALTLASIFPSKWLFTAITTHWVSVSMTRQSEVLLMDVERGLELPVALVDRGITQLSPNGQYVVSFNREDLVLSVTNVHNHSVQRFSMPPNPSTQTALRWQPNNRGFFITWGDTFYKYDFETQTLETLNLPNNDGGMPVLYENLMLFETPEGDIYRNNSQNTEDWELIIEGIDPDSYFDYSEIGGLAVARGNEILLVDVMTGDIIDQFTGINEEIFSLSWSPNSVWLTIYVYPTTNENTCLIQPRQLYTLNTETGAVYPIELAVESFDYAMWASWSPDSTQLAVSETNSASGELATIHITTSTGENRRFLTNSAKATVVRWLPDNESILYLEAIGNNRYELYRVYVNDPTLNAILLDRDLDIHTPFVHIMQGGNIIYVRRHIGESRVYLLNYETGEGRYLSSSHYFILEWALRSY